MAGGRNSTFVLTLMQTAERVEQWDRKSARNLHLHIFGVGIELRMQILAISHWKEVALGRINPGTQIRTWRVGENDLDGI